MSRNGKLHLHDTTISIWENHVDEKQMHRAVYGPLVKFLRSRGFRMCRDPHTVKHYRCISWNYHVGKKGNLEVKVDISGRHLQVVFFQNVNFENKNGGRYDFDKFEKMPYLMQKMFIKEASALLYHLQGSHGYEYGKNIGGCSYGQVINSLRGINRSKNPLKGFNDTWGDDRFARDETGWPTVSEYDHGYNKDREGVPLRNGMVRWIRGFNGYLKRGVIYTNMNDMWQVVYGPGERDTTWVHCRELFTLQSSDIRRRYFPKNHKKKKINEELAVAVKQMNFERAAILRDLINGEVCA